MAPKLFLVPAPGTKKPDEEEEEEASEIPKFDLKRAGLPAPTPPEKKPKTPGLKQPAALGLALRLNGTAPSTDQAGEPEPKPAVTILKPKAPGVPLQPEGLKAPTASEEPKAPDEASVPISMGRPTVGDMVVVIGKRQKGHKGKIIADNKEDKLYQIRGKSLWFREDEVERVVEKPKEAASSAATAAPVEKRESGMFVSLAKPMSAPGPGAALFPRWSELLLECARLKMQKLKAVADMDNELVSKIQKREGELNSLIKVEEKTAEADPSYPNGLKRLEDLKATAMKSGNHRTVELLKQQQEAMRIADSHKLSGDSIDWAHASVHLAAAALAAHESDHEFVLQELRKTAPSGADFFLRSNGAPTEAPKKTPADDIEVVAKFNPKLRVLEQETFDDFSIHFLGRVKVNPEFKTRTSKTSEAQLGAEKMLQAELAVWENARNLEKEAERDMRDAQQLDYQNQGPRGGPSSRETGGRGGYGGRGPGRIDLAGFGLTKPGGFALGLSHNPATAAVAERRYVEPKQAVWSTMGVRKQKLMKNVTQDMGKGVI